MPPTFGKTATTIFLCPVDGCDMRFKSTSGRTRHLHHKHTDFGVSHLQEHGPFNDASNDVVDISSSPRSSPQYSSDLVESVEGNCDIASSPSPDLGSSIPVTARDHGIQNFMQQAGGAFSPHIGPDVDMVDDTGPPTSEDPPETEPAPSVDYHPILNGNSKLWVYTYSWLINYSQALRQTR